MTTRISLITHKKKYFGVHVTSNQASVNFRFYFWETRPRFRELLVICCFFFVKKKLVFVVKLWTFCENFRSLKILCKFYVTRKVHQKFPILEGKLNLLGKFIGIFFIMYIKKHTLAKNKTSRKKRLRQISKVDRQESTELMDLLEEAESNTFFSLFTLDVDTINGCLD